MQRRATTQDISWFLDLRRNDQLDLDPPYQRRSVWNPKDRRFFLDTVFRGYPCPPIFLHKSSGTSAQKTMYAVVDGKQRLQTLFLFVDDLLSLDEKFGDARFNAKNWSELAQEEKQTFWDYVIPVEFLTFDTKDPHEVNQAFDRLNRNVRKLEAQELRHARWGGWLITNVETECEDPIWKRFGIGTSARSKRMKDAQFITELLLVVIEKKQHGFDQALLDEAYAKYDDLDESDLPVSPDDIKEEMADAKLYIDTMQSTNGCVKKYASTFAAFYTLWAAVVLHRRLLPDATLFAAKFADLRAKVDELKEATDLKAFLAGAEHVKYQFASDFLAAYGGASTDLTPRQKRLDALLGFIGA